MVVHETDRLHMSIHRRRSDEGEATLFQILRKGIRKRGRGRNGGLLRPAVDERLAVDEAPNIRIEGAELLGDCQESPSVLDRALDLATISDETIIQEEFLHLRRSEPGYLFGIEAGKGPAVRLALAEDGSPGKSGLLRFEKHEFEMLEIIVDGLAPFPIMVFNIERILAAPGASMHAHKIDSVCRAGKLAQEITNVIDKITLVLYYNACYKE